MDFLERWVEDGTMVTIYIAIAALGAGILLLQTLLQLVGIGDAADVGDADFDLDDGGVSVLSVRALAAFLAFFGLTGWGGTNAGWSTITIVLVALAIGGVVALLTAWLVSMQKRFQSAGNLRSEDAVGQTASVYLMIPAGNSGVGKIQVSLQGRTAEFAAFTAGDAIPTGRDVRIVRMRAPGTFEVEVI